MKSAKSKPEALATPEVPASADELSAEADASRARLDGLVSGLEERRHIGSAIQRRVRLHPVQTIGGVLLATGAVASGIALLVQRRRRREKIVPRLQKFALASKRVFRNPDQVARSEPDLGGKLLMTAATAVTGLVVKKVVQSILRSATGSPA